MQFENGTDVHFMNEYVQVVSQNLDVIMKNSFLLQAKYNVLEKALNQRIGNDGQVSEQISELQRQISSLAEEKNHLINREQDVSGERHRIQNLFNQEMRDHAQLKLNYSALEIEKAELLKNLKDALDNNQILNEKILELQKSVEVKAVKFEKTSEEVNPVKKEQKTLKKDLLNKSSKIEVKSGGTF